MRGAGDSARSGRSRRPKASDRARTQPVRWAPPAAPWPMLPVTGPSGRAVAQSGEPSRARWAGTAAWVPGASPMRPCLSAEARAPRGGGQASGSRRPSCGCPPATRSKATTATRSAAQRHRAARGPGDGRGAPRFRPAWRQPKARGMARRAPALSRCAVSGPGPASVSGPRPSCCASSPAMPRCTLRPPVPQRLRGVRGGPGAARADGGRLRPLRTERSGLARRGGSAASTVRGCPPRSVERERRPRARDGRGTRRGGGPEP